MFFLYFVLMYYNVIMVDLIVIKFVISEDVVVYDVWFCVKVECVMMLDIFSILYVEVMVKV